MSDNPEIRRRRQGRRLSYDIGGMRRESRCRRNRHVRPLTAVPGLALAKGAEMSGVFDINAQAARQAADEYGVTCFDSLDALLSSKPDLVYLSTPPASHVALLDPEIGAGRNVLSRQQSQLRLAGGAEAGCQLGEALMSFERAGHRLPREPGANPDNRGHRLYRRRQGAAHAAQAVRGNRAADPRLGAYRLQA